MKKCPCRSRVPHLFAVFHCDRESDGDHGRNDMALSLLVSWSSYARPIQLLPLQTQFLLKPGLASDHWRAMLKPTEESISSRTNEYDISVALHHASAVNLFLLVRLLKKAKGRSTGMVVHVS